MGAGRELDEKIATSLMSYEYLPDHPTHKWRQGNVYEFSPPRYSTDIADAWMVVEKMRERGYYVFEISVDGTNEYAARFGRCWPAPYENTEIEGTAPLAISLAALRAVGAGEVER